MPAKRKPRHTAPACYHPALDMLGLEASSIRQVIRNSRVVHAASANWTSWPAFLIWLMETVVGESDIAAYSKGKVMKRAEEIKNFLRNAQQTPVPILTAIEYHLQNKRNIWATTYQLDDFAGTLARDTWTRTDAWKDQSDPKREFLTDDESGSESSAQQDESIADSQCDDDVDAEDHSASDSASSSSEESEEAEEVEQAQALMDELPKARTSQRTLKHDTCAKRKHCEESPSDSIMKAAKRQKDNQRCNATSTKAQNPARNNVAVDDLSRTLLRASIERHDNQSIPNSQRGATPRIDTGLELCVHYRTVQGGFERVMTRVFPVEARQISDPAGLLQLLKTACNTANSDFYIAILAQQHDFHDDINLEQVNILNIQKMFQRSKGNTLTIIYGDTFDAADDMVTHVLNKWKGG